MALRILRALFCLLLIVGAGRADAYNFVRGASGGVVSPPWAVNQLLEMPYVCAQHIYINPSPSTYGSFGAGSLSANQGGTGTGSMSHPFLTLSALYAGNGDVNVDAGTCIDITNSTPLVDDGDSNAFFSPSELPSGHQGGDANTPTGYAVLRAVDGSGAYLPAAPQGATPDTVNSSAAHLIMSACGACSAVSGDPDFLAFWPPPSSDYWIVDGLNIEGVGSFTTQSFWGCVTVGNSPRLFNAATGPSHFQIRNTFIHGCGGAGIQVFGADWFAAQQNVVINTSGAPGYEESGIGVVVSAAGCTTFFLNCPPIQTGVDATIGTVINSRLIPYHQVITENWVDGHYEWGQPNQHTDGNCIIIDTDTISQGPPPTDTNSGAFQGRTLVANNVVTHCGGKGIHMFFSQFLDTINNTSYNTHFDPNMQTATREETDCFKVNDCNFIDNIGYAIGGNGTPRVSYTAAGVGPVSVQNVIPYLFSVGGGQPSGVAPMQVFMQDTTTNNIVGVTIDPTNLSALPGGVSGTLTFSNVVSNANGAAGAVIVPGSYHTSFNNSSFAFFFSALDTGNSGAVALCEPWAQQMPLPCTGGNLQLINMFSTGNQWLYNDWFGLNGAVGAGADLPTGAIALPDNPSAPANNLQATDPQFTNPAFTVGPNFILGSLPSRVAGGAAYTVGCVVTLAGNSPTTAAKVKVDAVTGSAITAWHLFANGSYPANTTSNFTQSSASCAGVGAIFTGTAAIYYRPLWISSARPDLSLQSGSPVKHAGSPDWCLSEDFAGNKRSCPSSIGAYE
jgi:hypothetical protein